MEKRLFLFLPDRISVRLKGRCRKNVNFKRMKKTLWLFVALSVSLTFFPSQASTPEDRGRFPSPVYSADGDLYLLFEKEEGVHFGHVFPIEDDPFIDATLLLHKPARHPHIGRGPLGNIWAVWEGAGEDVSHIYLASFVSGSWGTPLNISLKCEGMNTTPTLSVDKNGLPWVVWVNRSQGLSRIFVFRQETGQIQQVNSHSTSLLMTPRIKIDDNLDAWIFWVSQNRGPGEIHGRRLSGLRWSEEWALNAWGRYPHFDPCVDLDRSGRPWVVWTAYDGDDYEIFHSRWTGKEWTLESSLTNNRSLSDLSPSLCFLPCNSAILVWSQASRGSRICFKLYKNGKWSEARFLSTLDNFNRRPKIALGPSQLTVTWENTSGDKTRIQMSTTPFFSLDSLAAPPDSTSLKRTTQPVFWWKFAHLLHPLILEEARYSAFGDSITYGVINRTWFPDKGYVPRLDLLIKALSDTFHVLNRGIPGETTAEGLARVEEEIETYRAKYMLLMEGTNDMSAGVSSQVAAFNMEEMIRKCLLNGVYPLLGTIIPRSDSLWSGGLQQNTLLFNDSLRDLSSLFHIPLTDHYNEFMSYSAGYLALFSDGAHPNEEGYQKMAEAWFESTERIPWPPVNLAVERKTNKILFYNEPINILSWEENPLLSPETQIVMHSIYRKLKDENDQNFIVAAVVSGDSLSYIDRDVLSENSYSYFIIAEDNSGVKGPASLTVSDR